MKQETKLVAFVLVFLIVFLSGFGLGATKGITVKIEGGTGTAVQANGSAEQQPTAQQTQPQTTQPQATESPATTAPAGDSTTAPADNSGASTGSVPSTKEEVATAYNKAINDFKAFTGNCSWKKTETINIQVIDLPAMAATIVNKVVEGFTGTKEYTCEFTNGVGANGEKPADRMIPGGRNAAVDPAGLVSGTATANADGGYTMTLQFIAEDSIFDGTKNTSEPTYHMGAMDPLNLGSLDLGPVTITEANLHYPGATTVATVDSQGRLVKLDNKLPLKGSGSGKAGISLTLNMEGSMDSIYEIAYK
ncbi:MAG: hypothetical protein ACI4GC_09030 [Acutalibacteraceae bacterium]